MINAMRESCPWTAHMYQNATLHTYINTNITNSATTCSMGGSEPARCTETRSSASSSTIAATSQRLNRNAENKHGNSDWTEIVIILVCLEQMLM